MPAELTYLLAFSAALIGVLGMTPVAIRVARSTGFLDQPGDYKRHVAAMPYLGGLAVMGAIAFPAVVFGSAGFHYSTIALCAAALWLVGTVDDKVGLGPFTRIAVEVAAAVVLWFAGQGWGLDGPLGLLVTVVWVVGLVNAYNLMDNIDGAAATVTAASAAGIALIAGVGGDTELAAFALTVVGATLGFLVFNLRTPARIFLGDGGSMPLGFLIAALAMQLPATGNSGLITLLAIVPIAGLPILDTALVVISRTRRGANVLSGGRDHLTHRLRPVFGSTRSLATGLGTAQMALCLLASTLVGAHAGTVVAVTLTLLALGSVAIWALEASPAVAAEPAPAPVPELVPDPVGALGPATGPKPVRARRFVPAAQREHAAERDHAIIVAAVSDSSS